MQPARYCLLRSDFWRFALCAIMADGWERAQNGNRRRASCAVLSRSEIRKRELWKERMKGERKEKDELLLKINLFTAHYRGLGARYCGSGIFCGRRLRSCDFRVMEYQEATGFSLRALGVNDFPNRAPPVGPDFGATRADRLIKNTITMGH